MKTHGITGARLASLSGRRRESISRWLNGEPIGGDSAFALLEVFAQYDPRVSLNDLIVRD